MSHHVTTLLGSGDSWQAKCSCRWRSPVRSRAEAEAAMDKHSGEVSRARAWLRVRTPSLRTMRDYYRKEADNPDWSPEERELWSQLADELEPRIAATSDADQLHLWE